MLIIFKNYFLDLRENFTFNLNLVQYIFTCVFTLFSHLFFFIHDCNAFVGNLIPYIRPAFLKIQSFNGPVV